MKSFVVVLSALLFLLIAAAHAYRAYAGIPVLVGPMAGHAVAYALPIMASWICAGVTALLGLLLLVVRK